MFQERLRGRPSPTRRVLGGLGVPLVDRPRRLQDGSTTLLGHAAGDEFAHSGSATRLTRAAAGRRHRRPSAVTSSGCSSTAPGTPRPSGGGGQAGRRPLRRTVRARRRVVRRVVTVGVATSGTLTTRDLLPQADLALYVAKRRGRASGGGTGRPTTQGGVAARRAALRPPPVPSPPVSFESGVPTDRRPGRTVVAAGFGGPAALAPPRARADLTGAVHPGRRGQRPDRADGPLGADAAVAKAAHGAGAMTGRAGRGQRESLARANPQRTSSRRCARPGRHRAAALPS